VVIVGGVLLGTPRPVSAPVTVDVGESGSTPART
jgi:hypothetical protein